MVGEVDVIVTSYAIFRLDFEQFAAVEWAGLILDEAQFLKNPKTRANECARLLKAPFKLAVTGTPMENNLMELWAILAVVAPGLYTSATRFREDYVKTVTGGLRSRQSIRQADEGHLQEYGDEDRQADLGAARLGEAALTRLRRRIRPILLRRTKEQVAPELPDRIQQELHVELAPKHRRAYDLLLQRERQRVLRLLDEDYEGNRFTIFRSLTLLRRAALDISLTDPSGTPGCLRRSSTCCSSSSRTSLPPGIGRWCSASSRPSCARSPNGPTARGSATSTWTAPRDGGPRSSSGSRPAMPRCS